MTISLYAASIPVFKQMLNAMSGVLTKAEAHATAKNIDPSVFLQARLAPDMFPLVRQVQIAVDFAKGVSGRLAEVELPKYDDNEATFAELQALISKVLAIVDTLKPEQVDGKEAIEIVTRPGTPKEALHRPGLFAHLRFAAVFLSTSPPPTRFCAITALKSASAITWVRSDSAMNAH